MPYSLVTKKKLFYKIVFVAILTIITSKSIAQETNSANPNIADSQATNLPSNPLTKNRTASPILKTTNKNSSKTINTSITSPINSSPLKTNSNSTTTNAPTPKPSYAIKENTNAIPANNSPASPLSPAIKNEINKNNSSITAPSNQELPITNSSNNDSQITKSPTPTSSTENKNIDSPAPSLNNINSNQPQAVENKETLIDKKPLNKPRKKPIKKNKNPKITPIIKITENIETQNKKFVTEKGRKISPDYFLQIIAKKSCDSLSNTECFRRDRKDEDPYFHRTIVSIFNNHIVAEQYFTTTSVNKRIFLKVNNGNYQLTTTNDNLISFSVQDGEVKDLSLFSGNISRETFAPSKCVLAEKNFGFLLAHNKQPKISETSYFTNKNNFEGVRNLVIFSNIENSDNLSLLDLMAVEVKSYNDIAPIENLNLCKKAKSDILEVRQISKAECRKRQECLILLNSNPDFQNKIIDESCLGYFDSQRQDYVSCSQQDDCDDYAIIKDCEVKFMAGE